jgi:hypothetical protein
MRRTTLWVGAFLALALPAAAVEQGQVGLQVEVGSRRTIGLTYHATETLALRPAVFFQRVTAEQTPSLIDPDKPLVVFESDDTSFGGQMEVDYFLRPQRNLAPYLAATVSYSHVNTAYPVPQAGSLILRNGNLHNVTAGAGFGVQYAVTEAFHLFGQVGLSYSAGERFTVNGVKLHSHSWTTSTSAIGLVFYFN